MNTGNAFGFLFLAGMMGLAPSVAPQWFPPTGMDGSSGRALWLQLMAVAQSWVGASYLFSRWVAPAALRAALYLPGRKVRSGEMLPTSPQVQARAG